MTTSSKEPSRGWRDGIFGSPPRRSVANQSKSTTRIPVLTETGWQFGEGGHEATGLMLLRHLQHFGLVKRFKSQPFSLGEIGGPKDRIPDLLVELDGGSPTLHVVQVKSKRFLTEEVQQKFDSERALLESKGFGFHIWTDRDRLSRHTSHTVRMLDRGYRHRVPNDLAKRIRASAQNAKTLAPLLFEFGWDDTISAAALGAFHFHTLEKIHENTPIYLHFPRQLYADLFDTRNAAPNWWTGLAS
jgi:hypothetical protein